ncbi:MAG: ABC transporter ATP-binding protein [Candidatus Omnitrophica bacterium]|nr:ABC transporter ATP-binding protein [Candidatus Omnitrophota bacterium]
MILEVRNLTKSFDGGRVRAVRGVSFSLERGRTLGIVGESGCGKSTLARLILRLVPADEGRIRFEGRKRQIIFQHPFLSLDPRMTVEDSLKEAFFLQRAVDRRRWDEKISEALRRVELPENLRKRYPRELSGGECQRIAIARAVSADPELLVCDEPTSSLDRLAQAGILNLLLGIQLEKKMSLVFISHDLKIVRHMSDEVLVMREGEVCESGPRDRIFENPGHPYTRALLASVS